MKRNGLPGVIKKAGQSLLFYPVNYRLSNLCKSSFSEIISANHICQRLSAFIIFFQRSVMPLSFAFVFSIPSVIMIIVRRPVVFIPVIMAVADDYLSGTTTALVIGVFHPVYIVS